MTQIFPLLLLALVLVAMMVFSRRNKQRMAAADALRRERITTGTDVMTTSGLYGTVVSVNPDGTVLLSIAPGVEVRWTLAALREVSELPEQYREPIVGAGAQADPSQTPVEAPSPAAQPPSMTKSSPAAQPPSMTEPSSMTQPSSGTQPAAGPSSRRPRRRGASPG